ncbi:MAG: hypothetical protein GY820_00100, partial [Gammaproteobacteria bacterium]|nr:hypothetical protein [Gammaproteobacteria bacterium]
MHFTCQLKVELERVKTAIIAKTKPTRPSEGGRRFLRRITKAGVTLTQAPLNPWPCTSSRLRPTGPFILRRVLNF